jgi:Protein of unknown function (DUF2800)
VTKHSTIVGGSTADRLLNCAASFQLIQSLPEQIEIPSEYANYGSAMHACMDRIMAMYGDGFPPLDDMIETARELKGEYFYDRELTEQHLIDSIFPALETLDELQQLYGGGFRAVANELKVRFPGVPGAFGTTDLLIGNNEYIILVDWKFGMGVPVKAVYEDPRGDQVNPQLMFYFAATMHTMPKLFPKKRFVVAIIQPRVEEKLTHTIITRSEVKMFVEDIDNAIVASLQKNPTPTPGAHCRWCPASPICPAQTTALFELKDLGIIPDRPVPADSDGGDYGAFLAKAKRLADMVADYARQVDDAIHTYLEGGGTVPGWHLKYKTKLRQWIDPEIVEKELLDLGFTMPEIWQSKLQTFAVADKAAKRLGVKIPEHLRIAPESDETTITNDPNAPKLIDRETAEVEFREALKQLRHG